jgi:ribosomal protein S24E
MVELTIKEEKENKLLDRKEVVALVSVGGTTPSYGQVTKALSEKFKKAEDHIVVDHIYQKYGKQEAEVIAKIYNKAVKKADEKPAEGSASE